MAEAGEGGWLSGVMAQCTSLIFWLPFPGQQPAIDQEMGPRRQDWYILCLLLNARSACTSLICDLIIDERVHLLGFIKN